MNAKGASNYYQAVVYQKTSEKVIGSKDPKFSTLQPHPKQREEESWFQAYEFVYDFLQKYDMKSTLKTMECEFGDGPKPVLGHTFDEFDRSEYFKELQKVSSSLGQHSFKERVESFSKSEGLE